MHSYPNVLDPELLKKKKKKTKCLVALKIGSISFRNWVYGHLYMKIYMKMVTTTNYVPIMLRSGYLKKKYLNFIFCLQIFVNQTDA